MILSLPLVFTEDNFKKHKGGGRKKKSKIISFI